MLRKNHPRKGVLLASIDRHVTREVLSLDDKAPCREAAHLMEERRIGAIAVRRDGRIVGLVTERDIANRVVGRGVSPETAIGEVMRRDLPSIAPDASEQECTDRMREHITRHLLVEESGKVIGIISMRDVIRLMLDDKQFLIEQLQTYIDGR
ncbi:MAG: CBS domain-containing protein [Myxococcales bacterium]